MSKYRLLNDEELKHFEEELKQFLILNHVYAEEWKEINETNPEKALELVALFSDNVLQRVYENMHFLEKKTKDACFVFHFKQEVVDLKIIQSDRSENLDLSTAESLHHAMQNYLEDLSFYKSSKKYTETREQEIHQLIEQGAIPSSKMFWESLEEIIP